MTAARHSSLLGASAAVLLAFAQSTWASTPGPGPAASDVVARAGDLADAATRQFDAILTPGAAEPVIRIAQAKTRPAAADASVGDAFIDFANKSALDYQSVLRRLSGDKGPVPGATPALAATAGAAGVAIAKPSPAAVVGQPPSVKPSGPMPTPVADKAPAKAADEGWLSQWMQQAANAYQTVMGRLSGASGPVAGVPPPSKSWDPVAEAGRRAAETAAKQPGPEVKSAAVPDATRSAAADARKIADQKATEERKLAETRRAEVTAPDAKATADKSAAEKAAAEKAAADAKKAADERKAAEDKKLADAKAAADKA
ncbi:MAG: hypothetical protein KGP27_17530, partial [Hyphomicrobiales bacterium]|nr:hypothetical protein [Hyphomicrobiales bacterium]